jgi:hypothetical protein
VVGWEDLPGEDSLASARFDAFVRGVNGAGGADTISDVLVLRSGSLLAPTPATGGYVTRQGSILKIDASIDSAAPGAGSGWVFASQGQLPPNRILDNPIVVMQYNLGLDGSQGERELADIFAVQSGKPTIFIHVAAAPTLQATSLASTPTSLVVVPGPGMPMVVATAGCVLCMRRRRTNEQSGA